MIRLIRHFHFKPGIVLFLVVSLFLANKTMAVNHGLPYPLTSTPVLVGQARMEFLWWKIYEIQLFSETKVWSPNSTYALLIDYLIDIDSVKLAERTIIEIKNLGFTNESVLAKWLKTLNEVFPDIKKGDVLIGVYTRDRSTVFYKNGHFLAQINEPLFGELFFGIWLSEKTSEPKLRKQLLGQ